MQFYINVPELIYFIMHCYLWPVFCYSVVLVRSERVIETKGIYARH